jgi:hypothetical protein
MIAQCTITEQTYNFDILKKETETLIMGLAWRRFRQDYKLGQDDLVVFDMRLTVNAGFSVRMTPCDNLGIIKAPPSTREEVDLEESESLQFMSLFFFSSFLLDLIFYAFFYSVLCFST